MRTATLQSTKKMSWFDRLCDRFYNTNMNRTITYMRMEAPAHYRTMVTDLDAPMDSRFESLVANTLTRRELVDFRPSKVLFPRMMRQFGVNMADCQDSELRTMGKRCNQCDRISECWLALRANADQAECERFCPNAEALIAKAS